MDKKLKLALKQSFTPPASQNREKFANSISYPQATFNEVFLSQIRFIRKRVWVMFALCVCSAFFYINTVPIKSDIISVVSAILPLFVLCTTSEFFKSCSYNMEEMELACKYNLAKITLMRLGILGAASFVMLVLFICFANNNNFGVFRNAMYLTVPYLFSSYVSLLIVSKYHAKETTYVVAGVCGSVSFFMFLSNTSYAMIYHAAFTYLWGLAFATLAVLLALTLIKFTKLQEELQWNFA